VALPDLIITNAYLSDDTLTNGGTIQANWTVKNIGDGAMSSSSVKLYIRHPDGSYILGTDGQPKAFDSEHTNSLSPGASDTGESESFVLPIEDALPDLDIINATLSKTTFNAGGDVSITWGVQNLGDASIDFSRVYVAILDSNGQAITNPETGGDYFDTVTTAILQPGQSWGNGSSSFTLPPSIADGRPRSKRRTIRNSSASMSLQMRSLLRLRIYLKKATGSNFW